MKRFLLALIVTAAAAQNPSNSNVVVVGNEAQPVQFSHKQNIQAAITKAGLGGFIIIPADYPFPAETYSNPNNIPILDFRNNNLDIRPSLTLNGGPIGSGGSGCIVNPADGGCALAGNPTIDLFIGAVGPGTGWLFQMAAAGLNVKLPINVLGSTAGILTLGCGPDPGVGSGVAFAAPPSCTPYTVYMPSNSASGFWKGSNTANKLTMVFQSGIDLTQDATGVLPLLNGGTGNSTQSGALVALFPNFIRNGDLCCFWNGSAWINLAGNSAAAGTVGFLTENSGGSWSFTVSPLGTPVGGTGVSTKTANVVYKGNGTGAELPSTITDDGTNVSITGQFTAPVVQVASKFQAASCTAVGTTANPSVVSCTGKSAGRFACDAAASTGTCQVNTTQAFSASQIFLTNDTADNTPLGVTCNTSADSGLTKPRLASINTGVSFTINLGTFAGNQECFQYFIVN